MPASPKNSKKTRCKLASPICHDRAEAFVGPQAEVRPRFGDVPTERDKRAFELAARGMTQRQIAAELKISQPTVHRSIKKYRCWFGATLPEDRGEMTGFSRFRVALERHRLFLEHQQELSMQEWAQSRQTTVESNTKKTYPEGRKSNGPKVEEVTTQEQKRRHGARVSHFNAATNLSRELLMLEAGHIGVHRMTCDLAMDPDERDRWGRERETAGATIAELTAMVAALTQKVAELEARLTPQKNASQAESGDPSKSDESETAPPTTPRHRGSPASSAASPLKQAPCGNEPDSGSPACADHESGESWRQQPADH